MKNLCIALLLLGSLSSYAAKVDTLAIPSAAMGKTYNAAIVLPDSYAKNKANYPCCTCCTAPTAILGTG